MSARRTWPVPAPAAAALLGGLALLALAGCSRKPPPQLLPGQAAPPFDARLLVRIQREGKAPRAAHTRWLSDGGGKLLIAARYGPLVPLMTLVAGGDSVQILLPRQDAYASAGRGDPVGEDSTVTFDRAVRWLRGLLEPRELAQELHRPRVVRRGGMTVHRGLADGPRGRVVAEVWHDSASGRVLKWSLDDLDGTRLLLVEYPGEARREGFLPEEVRVYWPTERIAGDMLLERLSILDGPPPTERFVLDPPDDVPRVALGFSWDEVLD